MNELILDLVEVLVKIAFAVGISLFGYVKFRASKQLTPEQLVMIQGVIAFSAQEAVKYVQQSPKFQDKQEKLQVAMEVFFADLQDQGIDISQDIIESKIESALIDMKAEFGEQW
jgi:hypothetical protein